jgi:hypothetical protein
MQCYIKSEYAADYPAAAMIGYVQSNRPNYWYKQLQRKLAADKKKDLNITVPLKEVKFFDLLPHEWISRHKRERNGDIDVFHIFLDFTVDG